MTQKHDAEIIEAFAAFVARRHKPGERARIVQVRDDLNEREAKYYRDLCMDFTRDVSEACRRFAAEKGEIR